MNTVIKTIQKLHSLGELQAGWNSYAAQPIRHDVIENGIRWVPSVLQAMTPEPQVVPRVGGSLQLEWHRRGVDLEIYIDSPTDIHFSARDSGRLETVEAPLKGNEALLDTWIARITDPT